MSKNRDYGLDRSSASIACPGLLPGSSVHGLDDPDVARQQRDAFVESTQSRLEVLDHELSRLDEQARELDDIEKLQWLRKRGELNEQRRRAWQKLQHVRSDSTTAWLHVAQEIDSARQDLSASISELRCRQMRCR